MDAFNEIGANSSGECADDLATTASPVRIPEDAALCGEDGLAVKQRTPFKVLPTILNNTASDGGRLADGPLLTNGALPAVKLRGRKAKDGGGLTRRVSRKNPAPAEKCPGNGAGEEGQSVRVTHASSAVLSSTIDAIHSLQIQRVACQKARIRQDNATGALVRRFCGWSLEQTEKERSAACKRAASIVKAVESGAELKAEADRAIADTLGGFILGAALARKPFDAMLADIEKRMVKAAKSLPVYGWCESVRGFGAMGLAVIVGECGDLSNYSNPAKVWKRMGLGLVGGTRQGNPGTGASAEDWIAHGYSPRRRSAMWNIGDPLIKANVRKPEGDVDEGERIALSDLGQIYLDRKAYEVARNPEIKPIAAHRRAQRYMEKRLLRDLWRAWRDA